MNTVTKCFIISTVGLFACCLPAIGQTPEELLAIHGAQLAAMNAHDLDTMMSYWAQDGVYDLVHSPPPAPNAYVRTSFAQRFAAYSDFQMVMGRVLAAEKVVVEEGTTLYTDAKTGVKITIPHLSIYDFEGDKIKRVTSYNDRVGSMVLRGQMPAPGMPSLVPSSAAPAPESTGLSPLAANAELVRRWNGHDAASVAKMDHADVQIFAQPLGMHVDRAQMMALNEQYFAAFPDDVLEVVRTIDLGDGWVLTELISKATHRESFMGVPASGYPMYVRVLWLTRYDAGGLIADMSFYYDNLTLINQMTTPEWSLDGIWISTVPTPLGNLIMTTTYVAQNVDRTCYSGSLEEINVLPLLAEIYPDADPNPKWAGGHAVRVGRNTYEATYLGYSTKTVESPMGRTAEYMGLFTARAHFQIIGPDLIYGEGAGSYYMAAQDADRDGFPDAGQEPVVCLPWGWMAKRLTLLPGCTPTPVPQAPKP
jgi:steroid delta-isomerase-like uncharacterized protein